MDEGPEQLAVAADNVYESDSSDSHEDCYSASASSSPCDSTHSSSTHQVSLHWFRYHALRLHDNPSLMASLSNPNTTFKGVFILDPWFTAGHEHSKFGVNRLRFLLECLHDLHNQLDALALKLYVARGQTTSTLANLCQEWNVSHLTFQESQELHSATEEKTINEMASMMNIKVEHSRCRHTLYDPAEILKLYNSKPLVTYKAFRSILSKLKPPSLPIVGPSLKDHYKEDNTPYLVTHKFRIPTLAALGYDCEMGDSSWIGGETEALKRLDSYCQVRCQPFKNPYDCLFDKTSLSPYVRFGCLSVRYFWYHVRELAAKDKTKIAFAQEVSSKLLQREFYFIVSSQVPNFDSDRNNPICMKLPWEKDPELLQRWNSGRTGYPWIDAAIRQMQQEGWIHHLLRECIAIFLTRGDLWITWTNGAEEFETYMLDYEPSVSCGCWMKSSSSAFITETIEHYNPITFGQQLDPNGYYIRYFIPELQHFPKEYIYSPWMAPLDVQRRARCMVGQDYPHPVVDHYTTGLICMERVKTFIETLQFNFH